MSKRGFAILCADGYHRHCHPIIAGMMVDYEEQALITGVKNLKHCTVCQVRPGDRENLCKDSPIRSHKATKDQIRRQQRRDLGASAKMTGEMDVHLVSNFAWNHPFVNIHTTLMPDILHQLLKGVVEHLVEWVVALLEDTVKVSTRHAGVNAGVKRKRGNRTVANSSFGIQLDERFREVPKFHDMKPFPHYSKVSQWTGNEQKALVQQLITVVAPFLTARFPAAMHCTRALMDFVVLAAYSSHDEDTLLYMTEALKRVDMLKSVFKNSRPIDKSTGKPHFNIPKLHAMTHYVQFIRLYGSAQGYDTSYSEALHKVLVKEFFARTNKNAGFETQILQHNVRRHNMTAMEDVLHYTATSQESQADVDARVHLTKATRDPVDLTSLQIPYDSEVEDELAGYKLKLNCWRRAKDVQSVVQIPDFIDALAVFVRESRKKFDGHMPVGDETDRREPSATWVEDYYISLHGSISCWERDGKDSNSTDTLVERHARCSPAWRGIPNNWRRDCVWVQEHLPGQMASNHANEPLEIHQTRRLGKLQLIVAVLEPTRQGRQGKPLKYTGALIELFRWRLGGQVHKTHGMFEVERQPPTVSANPRNLHAFRFYEIPTIIHCAHLVPTNSTNQIFYVNSWINWEAYNTVYDKEFLESNMQAARKYSRKL